MGTWFTDREKSADACSGMVRMAHSDPVINEFMNRWKLSASVLRIFNAERMLRNLKIEFLEIIGRKKICFIYCTLEWTSFRILFLQPFP